MNTIILLVGLVSAGLAAPQGNVVQRKSPQLFAAQGSSPQLFASPQGRSPQLFANPPQLFASPFIKSPQSFAPQSKPSQRTSVNPQDGKYEIIEAKVFNMAGPVNGVYSYEYETANGIKRSEKGGPVPPKGAINSEGSWTVTYPNGKVGTFAFIANDKGFNVESDMLPTDHPIPAHVQEQIDTANLQRSKGEVHDGQYDHDRYNAGK